MRGNTKKGSFTSGSGAFRSKPVTANVRGSVSTIRLPAAPAGEAGEKIQFELTAEPGSRVFVAGTFNNWDPTATPLAENSKGGDFRTTVRIPEGRHEYKFVVNGVWCVDPQCPDWTPNDFGSLNSVIQIRGDTRATA